MLNFDHREGDRSRLKRPATSALVIGFIAAIVGLGSTFASNISINSGPIEFGQGVAQIVACSGDDFVTVAPKSEFVNDSENAVFKLITISLTHIPSSCWGKRFTVQAYDSEGNLLQINATSTSVAADYFGTGTQSSDGAIINASGQHTEGSYGGFDLEITTPVADAKDVYSVTIQSSQAHLAGLVAYWDFNNPGALGNSSFGDFNLQACGNPTSGSGVQGTDGLQLDGQSYLASSTVNLVRVSAPCVFETTIPTPQVLLGNVNYTKTAWFKNSGSNSNGGILAWGTTGCGNTTNLRFNGFDSFSEYWWDCDFVPTVSGSSFNDNQWHFVASTFDGIARKLYFDGELIGSDIAASAPDFQNTQFIIGATIGDEAFSGTLDNVAVYNIALSGVAISDLYHSHG